MLKGIDLSYANGNIDFSKIDKSQVQFVILRSSYGWESNQKDDQFERNYTGFKKLNIPVGVYHYSYARNANEGIKEAEYCLSCIKGKKFELPIYLDMEDSSVTSAGKTNLTNAALAFCQRIEKAGYKAGIYSFTSFINNYLDINKIKMAGYSFWLAEWHDGNPSMNCDIWQHKVGSAGTVKGVNGEIDMNYLYNTSIFATTNTISTANNSNNKTNNSNKNEVSQINSSSTVNYNVKITSSNGVNIRNGAGTGYKIIGAVPYNITLKVTKQTNGGGYTWGLITYNGVKGWIALNYTKKIENTVTLKKGDKVKVKSGAVVYGTNQALSSFVYKTTYQIIEISGNRVVIGINGQVTTAVDKKYLIKV